MLSIPYAAFATGYATPSLVPCVEHLGSTPVVEHMTCRFSVIPILELYSPAHKRVHGIVEIDFPAFRIPYLPIHPEGEMVGYYAFCMNCTAGR